MTDIREIRQPVEMTYRAFEQKFEQALFSDNVLLNDVLSYLAQRQGKYLRPVLLLLSSQICHGVTDKSIDAAVAMELLHTASLIHDDVVDSSSMRHGSETIQYVWNNKVAVLAGDYLFAEAIKIIAQVRSIPILSVMADMCRNLSKGEIVEIHANTSMWIDEQQYFDIIEAKTATLFAACAEIGATASGGTMRQVTALREFGRLMGICFQLKDDVFDYSDIETDTLGKMTMSDIRDGKVTLPLIIALKRAPIAEAETIKMLCEQQMAAGSPADMDREHTLKSFVLRYEGLKYSYQKMRECKQKAVQALDCFHDSVTKRSLLALLDYSINRFH